MCVCVCVCVREHERVSVRVRVRVCLFSFPEWCVYHCGSVSSERVWNEGGRGECAGADQTPRLRP